MIREIERHFVLGGKVILHQSAERGHRAGLDGVMLGAAIEAPKKNQKYKVFDLGAGVGTAGLCVAARLPGVNVTLVENDGAVLDLAERTLADPINVSFADRVDLLNADVTLRGEAREAAGLEANKADHVIMNPPFWDPKSVRTSPHEKKASAHVLDEEGLVPWFRTATALLKGSGKLSVIFPTDRLDLILLEMRGRFGGLAIYPLYKGAHEDAGRVIVQGIKGSRAPTRLLPGLILHEPPRPGDDRRPYTPIAEDVLNGRTSLGI